MYVNAKKKEMENVAEHSVCSARLTYIHISRTEEDTRWLHTHTVYTINTRITLNEYTMMIPW